MRRTFHRLLPPARRRPGRPLVSPIALAASLAIEWSDFSIPFDPEPARATLAAFLAENGAVPSPAPVAEPSPATPAPEPAPPSAESPKHYRRVRVRVRHERHRHRSILRRLVDEPLSSVRRGCFSFAQWLRYAVRSWLLYR